MTEVTPLPARSTDALHKMLLWKVDELIGAGAAPGPHVVGRAIDWYEGRTGETIPMEEQRKLVRELGQLSAAAAAAPAKPEPAARAGSQGPAFSRWLNALSQRILPDVMALLDLAELADLAEDAQRETIAQAVRSVSRLQKLELNGAESAELIDYVLDDMMGFGPLERLLADDTVSDIMVNGPQQVYVERAGRMELTDMSFRDDGHVLNIATRIVSAAGRRVDETTPLVDARLPDGSRINVTIPPLALDGPTLTIRKFPKDELHLADLVARSSMSPAMAAFLRLAAKMRLNLLISGGTGSGKTTLLNAISREIPANERIVTIEDAAELRLQQPHVVRLETRPPTIEGLGEITMRHLFRNSLRMRPDRIIIGEVRGDEAFDLLQAMNTGHDGSMSTLHANSPREALTRLENMIAMSGIALPVAFIRQQMKDAIHLVVQIARMRDGVRRVSSISEIVGMGGDTVSIQELFRFQAEPGQGGDAVVGRFMATGAGPLFMPRAAEMGLEAALRQTLEG